jgi:hypothetical protein
MLLVEDDVVELVIQPIAPAPLVESTCPAVPWGSNVVRPAPVWYGIDPARPPAMFTAVVAVPVSVPVSVPVAVRLLIVAVVITGAVSVLLVSV